MAVHSIKWGASGHKYLFDEAVLVPDTNLAEL